MSRRTCLSALLLFVANIGVGAFTLVLYLTPDVDMKFVAVVFAPWSDGTADVRAISAAGGKVVAGPIWPSTYQIVIEAPNRSAIQALKAGGAYLVLANRSERICSSPGRRA